MIAFQKVVILRRLAKRGLEGRTALIQRHLHFCPAAALHSPAAYREQPDEAGLCQIGRPLACEELTVNAQPSGPARSNES